MEVNTMEEYTRQHILHKINKKLGEMTKVFKGFINPKTVVKNTFSRKLQNTIKELYWYNLKPLLGS